jgi:cytochrome c556
MSSGLKRTCAAGAVAIVGLISTGFAIGADGEAAIKARKAFMDEELYGQFKVLAAYAKNGKGSLADVEKSAKAIAELSKKLTSHFPKGTGRGDYPATLTRALPEIWQDWPRFEKEAQRLTEGSETLARLASAGDKDAVVDMIGPSGRHGGTKIGCNECHKSFQGKRVKK